MIEFCHTGNGNPGNELTFLYIWGSFTYLFIYLYFFSIILKDT